LGQTPESTAKLSSPLLLWPHFGQIISILSAFLLGAYPEAAVKSKYRYERSG